MANFICGLFVGALIGMVSMGVICMAGKTSEKEVEHFNAQKREARIRALLNGGRDLL